MKCSAIGKELSPNASSAAEQTASIAASTAEQTDAAYCRRCIPTKARLDLIYQRNQSVCFDVKLIWQTAARVLR